ncbi:MAG TPA: DUF4114 domain-containing protein [Methylophilus sp.]
MKPYHLIMGLSLMAVSTAALSAEPVQPQPTTPGFFLNGNTLTVATPGEVVLTFLSASASFSSDLFLVGTPSAILNNQTTVAGTQYSLGSFAEGAELTFNLFVNDTGFTYSTGAGNLNPDGLVHAAYAFNGNQPLTLGFEDLFAAGDSDYNDLVVSLNNVAITPVPEPETYGMLLAGLTVLGAYAKRRKS